MNIFFLDPDNPQKLWPWWELGVFFGLLVLIFFLYQTVMGQGTSMKQHKLNAGDTYSRVPRILSVQAL